MVHSSRQHVASLGVIAGIHSRVDKAWISPVRYTTSGCTNRQPSELHAGMLQQAGSPPGKAEDSQLNDMSAGLPSLTGDLGSDVLKPLSTFDSETLSQPSVATPSPSEASLATASTTSTSASFTLKSDTTIDSDTAKAIEAVRNSLGAKDGAGLTLDQLTKRAQAKESWLI